MLSGIYAEYRRQAHNAECHSEYRYPECRFAEYCRTVIYNFVSTCEQTF
jgi:hypothetical protein